jgi:hypothetical protein
LHPAARTGALRVSRLPLWAPRRTAAQLVERQKFWELTISPLRPLCMFTTTLLSGASGIAAKVALVVS